MSFLSFLLYYNVNTYIFRMSTIICLRLRNITSLFLFKKIVLREQLLPSNNFDHFDCIWTLLNDKDSS